jgi:hypothetical protein
MNPYTVIYYIREDDNSVWDFQSFDRNDDCRNILKKEFDLYKKHLFPRLDSNGKLEESDCCYLPHKGNLYLVEKVQLFKYSQADLDLPEISKRFFANTLDNEEWIDQELKRIKDDLTSLTTDVKNDKSLLVENWFLRKLIQRFPNQAAFQNHLSRVKVTDTTPGKLGSHLISLCEKVLGWDLPKNISDKKWNRLINYFVKAPITPIITYKLEEIEVESENEVPCEKLKDDFLSVVEKGTKKYSTEYFKWWEKKRQQKQQEKKTKSALLDIRNTLAILHKTLKLFEKNLHNELSDRIRNKINESVRMLETSLLDVTVPARLSVEEVVPVMEDFNRICGASSLFEKLMHYLDEDDLFLYKENEKLKCECHLNRITNIEKVESHITSIQVTQRFKLTFPRFSMEEIEEMCKDKSYRIKLIQSSVYLKNLSIQYEDGSFDFLTLANSSLFLIKYFSDFLLEKCNLLQFMNVYSSVSDNRHLMIQKLIQIQPKWLQREHEWKPSIEEIELRIPIDLKLFLEILGFISEFCCLWNIQINVGADSMLEWMKESSREVSLLLDLNVVPINELDMVLTLQCGVFLKDQKDPSSPFHCFVHIDSYKSECDISHIFRTNYVNQLSKDEKIICCFPLNDQIRNHSVVNSITYNLLFSVYLLQFPDKILKCMKKRIDQSLDYYLNKISSPISKMQKAYLKRGKIPKGIGKAFQDGRILFPVESIENRECLDWLKKFT